MPRHRQGYKKLGRSPAHRRATLRNLVTNLLERERITTTLSKAKALRPLAEQMITLGKRDTLHARRQAAAFLLRPPVLQKLFSTLAPRFADRNGGYTRILSLGWRRGDGSDLAVVELIGSEFKPKTKKKEKKKKPEPAPPAAEPQPESTPDQGSAPS
ncbi:50S ribosomal protein L17 [Acidobacteriia bacterium AH_259_A11_L15]|nr:50S ribosomal protein L17 [Acidobacteriia bacterium AH_259_A11_L15]